MPLIKRYPNRKLYDTEAKQYITLDGVAELIRRGEQIEVTDNATGDDLTALTLSQIILEQEKKPGGFLPRALLTNLIREGSQRLGSLQRSWRIPHFEQQVNAEIRRRFEILVEMGQLPDTEAEELAEKLINLPPATPNSEWIPLGLVEQILHAHGIPTKTQIERLTTEIDSLNRKVEQLSKSEQS